MGWSKLARSIAIGLVSILAMACLAIAAGIRYNGSESFPKGFYGEISQPAQRGDLVFSAVPDSPLFEMAQDRGYMNVAFSPVRHLLKRLVAVAGDRVTIDLDGVKVNGIRLENSAPVTCDMGGRPLSPWLMNHEILVPGEVLLMSEYNPASFDSRYFGPVQSSLIESAVMPLWTWE